VLIEKGANVNAQNNRRNTALMIVLKYKKVDKIIYFRIAELLINNKAMYDINELQAKLNLEGGKKTKRKTRKSKKTRRRRHSKRRR